MSEIDTKIISDVKMIFSAYLEHHKQRKTPERFSILEEIYSNHTHFDAEELYLQMKKNQYNVSRATVYNTLELLVNCDLVTKHQFGSKSRTIRKSLWIQTTRSYYLQQLWQSSRVL
jgi:Fur family ferric uptake transcriptional regulator